MKKTIERLLSRTGDVALRRRAAWILGIVSSKNPRNILDVGCGDGFYLHLLSIIYPQVKLFGVDSSPKALKSALVNLQGRKVKLSQASVYHLPYPNKSFDVIILSEVLEHLTHDGRGLREAYRVLKPTGAIIVSVPHANYPFFWDPINWVMERTLGSHVQKGFWAGIWNQHRRLYTSERLISKLKKSRFREIETSIFTSYCLPFNHYLLNLFARFLVGRRGSRVERYISKFNPRSQNGMLSLNPFWLIFQLDRLNNTDAKSKVGVSLVVAAKK